MDMLLFASQAPLKGLGEHTMLVLLLQLCVILGLARLLGEGMRKLGQPAVIGELLAWPDSRAFGAGHRRSQPPELHLPSRTDSGRLAIGESPGWACCCY